MNNFDYNRAIFSSNLSTNAKITALAIAVHYNWKTKAESYPSIIMLTKETGLSKASIHRAKIELVSQGYLVSQRRFNNSNLYLPVIPAGLTLRDTPSHTEELKDNIKDNLKDNKEDDSSESSVSVIIDLNQEDTISLDTIWKVFEDDEREPRRAAPAGSSNRKPARSNIGSGRFNSNNATKPRVDQILDKAREW